MEKQLLINEPFINTSNIYGTLFSILSIDELTKPWVFSNFVQLRYVVDWDVYFFDNHDLIFEICPFLEKYSVDRNLLLKWSNFTDFIIELINNETYIWCHIDRFYIPSFAQYKNQSDFHEILIHGYDITNNLIYFSDNLADGVFKKSFCTFEEMNFAFINVKSDHDYVTRVNLIKRKIINNLYSYTFNREHMLDSFHRYLFSKRNFDLINPSTNSIYGIKIYDNLITTVEYTKGKNKDLDIRAFHLIWEHKKIMVERLKYLIDSSYLINSEELLSEYEIIEQDSLILRNLVIKYNLINQSNLLNKIENRLLAIRDSERSILTKLLQHL